METVDISLGVGACLLGEPVRFNGEAKRANQTLKQLGELFSLETTCPEVGIGLGVPRETIRLVDVDGEDRARDSATQEKDYTHQLHEYGAQQLAANPHWCGYIGVKGSPSCGHSRVRRYNLKGNAIPDGGEGIFVKSLRRHNPLLPIEEDGRLNDAGLRNSFVLRVMTYARWQALRAATIDADGLLRFHARHKYLLMAHSVPIYQQLGRLLADLRGASLESIADEYIAALMAAFERVPGRGHHANALQHISGYLKKKISARERAELRGEIDLYRSGAVPLVVPVTLLRSYFQRYPDPYIAGQYFMQPYPAELGLRNNL